MKTIGIIGGMSWESTVTYYDIINKESWPSWNQVYDDSGLYHR